MKPIAIFDIDGTIFRSSLTIELFNELVRRKVFSVAAQKRVERAEKKWLNRSAGYEPFVLSIVREYTKEIKGKKVREIKQAAKAVVSHMKFRTYRYTRDLIEQIRDKYFTIGVSGSPYEIVDEYNKFLKFDKFYGWEFGIDEKDRYTGKVLHVPPFYKKEIIVRYVKKHALSLKRSIGVGDTESDIGFLDLVDRPIAFNPNQTLAQHAKRKNWDIVIERKDLIINFKPKKVKYIKI